MHKISVLVLGTKNFSTSLEELKDHLTFKITVADEKTYSDLLEKHDILFIHQDFFNKSTSNKMLQNSKIIKILVRYNNEIKSSNFNDNILLPTSVKTVNNVVEKSIIKKKFSANSSIKIKDYILDKNEKKLIINKKFVLLTEKEIQLLELFLGNSQPINRNKILNQVWKYSKDADTHTVETHIYRLRKKIKDKFLDENFELLELSDVKDI